MITETEPKSGTKTLEIAQITTRGYPGVMTILATDGTVWESECDVHPKDRIWYQVRCEVEVPTVLSSLEPNELPAWAEDTEVFWNGSGFTPGSKIIWNGGEEVTKFISAEQLSTIVKPSTVQAPLPFTLETCVLTEGKESAKLPFTFIA